MAKTFTHGLWEVLYGEVDPARCWTLQDHSDSIAKSLEDLLNTRKTISDELTAHLPKVRQSILTYGLVDFSALCISSDSDRQRICSAVTTAILNHEPRLIDVRARLHPESTSINRFEFVIWARLKDVAHGAHVQFGGVLEPSAQRCTVRSIGV